MEIFPTSCFAEIYHGRWGIEELYKISKMFIEIEEFHVKTERGVRQELYAHILLINLSRFFEYEAQKLIIPKKGKESGNAEKLGMLIKLCHANFSTIEKSYFLFIFNPNLSGNIMSSCDMVKAQSGNGILHFLLAA